MASEPNEREDSPIHINRIDVSQNGRAHSYLIAIPFPKIPAIADLTFDSFARDSARDITCIAPTRTVVRREEEMTFIRQIRKVENVEEPLACPIATTEMAPLVSVPSSF